MPPSGPVAHAPAPERSPAIAVSATFTAEAIAPALRFWMRELNLDYGIRFASYSQLFQQLLDPAGLFARNRGGLNVAMVRFEDWSRHGAADLAENCHRLVQAVQSAAGSFASPLILAICPPSSGHEASFAPLERIVCQGAAHLGSVHLIVPGDVAALYPVSDCHDPHADELGHLPYTPVYFAALGTAIARRIHAIAGAPFKVAVLDCDETLWQGICGEDGPRAVVIDPPRRTLQEFMAERRRSGLLLALASKNNEEDVLETFAAHPEMPLTLDDFVARRINWEPKSANLAALAGELELGLDSFILVDDNPKECAEAQAACPGILALALPSGPPEIPEFLRHVWAFDGARVTEEDRRRTELYAQQAGRERLRRASSSIEEFLASLRLEVRIAPAEAASLARIAQLTGRTNQMNLAPRRRTEPELEEMLRADGAECLAVEVADRFGSYGIAGAILYRVQGGALAVDAFLLSCRALGRGVEHRMVARLGEIAIERGLKRVDLPFAPSQRNRPARLFLESIASGPADGWFRLSVAEAAAVRYRPGAGVSEEGADEPPASTPRRPVDYVRVATELRDPWRILERIREFEGRPAPPRTPSPEPRTALERELAELWAEVLHVPSVGVEDNFFDLGGHSLLAVQLLSRVRQMCAADLSLEVVYRGEFTVAELAKAIELKEIEQTGGQYADLLREIDALSDEEVRALLAQEQERV